MLAIGAAILLAGATIAPTVSSIYAMVDGVAPAGTHTEAFSWLLTASLTGSATGASVGGAIAQSGGAQAVFALVGAAGGFAALVAVVRSRTLTDVARARDWAFLSPPGGWRDVLSQTLSRPAPLLTVGENGRERWIPLTDRISIGNRRECPRPGIASTDHGTCPIPTTQLEEQ